MRLHSTTPGRPPHSQTLIGNRYGRWIVISECFLKTHGSGRRSSFCKVRCDCGKESEVSVNLLLANKTGGCKACAPRRCVMVQGERFSRWTVLQPNIRKEDPKGGFRYYCLVECVCGARAEVASYSLRKGTSQGCAQCLRDRPEHPFTKTHGRLPRKLHAIWGSMKSRCYNSQNQAYHDYGGRGIRVCDEWLDYARFRDWSLKNGYDETRSLERLDNDSHYTPSNCCWATKLQQANNTRTNIKVTWNGETRSVAQWARDPRCKVTAATLAARIRSRWPTEEAVTTPSGGRSRRQLSPSQSEDVVQRFLSGESVATLARHFSVGRNVIEHTVDPEYSRERRQVVSHNRRARKLGIPGAVTHAEWKLLRDLCSNRCVCCGTAGPLTVDHVIPFSKDGSSNWLSNWQPLCSKCNSEKGGRSTDYRSPHVRQALGLPQKAEAQLTLV